MLLIFTTSDRADFLPNFASDFKEAVKECNNTHYGLQSGIFTKDLNKAFYAFEHMEVRTYLPTLFFSSDSHVPYMIFPYLLAMTRAVFIMFFFRKRYIVV